jgi:hypothetical protein
MLPVVLLTLMNAPLDEVSARLAIPAAYPTGGAVAPILTEYRPPLGG